MYEELSEKLKMKERRSEKENDKEENIEVQEKLRIALSNVVVLQDRLSQYEQNLAMLKNKLEIAKSIDRVKQQQAIRSEEGTNAEITSNLTTKNDSFFGSNVKENIGLLQFEDIFSLRIFFENPFWLLLASHLFLLSYVLYKWITG